MRLVLTVISAMRATTLVAGRVVPLTLTKEAKHLSSQLALVSKLLEAGVVSKYSPDQPRDEDGQWTSGGGSSAVSAAGKVRDWYNGLSPATRAAMVVTLATAGLGAAGAAARYGPRAVGLVRDVARATKPQTFRSTMRSAMAADMRRAKPGVRRASTFSVGDAEAAARRAARRAKESVQAQAAARRAAAARKPGTRKSIDLFKGYPEYNADQPRADDGTWGGGGSGGGGGSSGRRDTNPAGITIAVSGLHAKTPEQANAALRQGVKAYDAMRKLPADSKVWRDPTVLDKAWDTYKSAMALFGIGTAASVVAGGAAFSGVVVGGAHLTPTHAAISAALMSMFPNTMSAISYAAAKKYLGILFPSEARFVTAGTRGLVLAGGAAAATGALLATALTLRYAYRKIVTDGKYQGVSSINARMNEIDGHLGLINNRLHQLGA